MLSEDPPTIDTEKSNIPSLECPDCNENWMHQSAVNIFSRNHEDAETGLNVQVDGTLEVTTDVDTDDGNPSKRRSGLIIEFWCEQCNNKDDPHELVIAQHKGNEHIYWK